ncbi:benzoate 4-monooxygenase cytochrome P450 [Diaporthe sp. PMI_573]|nr:benzoate 4-monooxygenase cytochrome P450 [Diaporthaceae sp. PMI_573]
MGLIFLFFVVLYLSITRFRTRSRLSAFSGPFFASVSYLPMLRIRLSGRSHLEYFELSKKYGSMVRIGPNDLLASNPDYLRRMSAARTTYERSSWYKATRLDPYHDMMGSIMGKHAHMSLRSKLAAGYMGRDIPNLESDLDSQVQALVSLIKPLGLLETNKDVRGIVAVVKLALDWIQVFTDIPPLQRIFFSNVLLKLVGPRPTDSWGVGYLMGMARELVASRMGPDAKDQQDLLGSFLNHGLDRRSAESEIMFPLIAGSDTTANAIKMTVSHIAASPSVASELQNELDRAAAEGLISQPSTDEEATKLLYLDAVVTEGLRVNPPFGGLIMKQVGPKGDTLNGQFIPPGTRIGHSTWAVAHDVSLFGADADVFRPERWLEADGKTRSLMRKQTDLVFGAGRWGCPARTVAFIELKKVIVELFRNFDFQFIIDEPSCKIHHHLFMSGSLPMSVTLREI